MSNKVHIVVYVGRRLGNDGKIHYTYQPTTQEGVPQGDVFCFSKRIKACYGIGTFATLEETDDNRFQIGAAKYADISSETVSKLAVGWRAKDEAAQGMIDVARKSKGEDVWFEALGTLKTAYRNSDRGQRAIIIAKLIQYLDSP